MFGQELGPKEGQQLLEKLAKTQLCFCCAHGRPTTAPLVHLSEYKGLRMQVGVEQLQKSRLENRRLSVHGLKLKVQAQ
jgi:hypothetical protein